MKKSFWIIWLGPKFNGDCLYKRHKQERQGRKKQCDERGRAEWSDNNPDT